MTRPFWQDGRIAALILLIAAIILRSPDFGNPIVEVDEQFYVLIGDRMVTQGAIPFVDIWDRKPIGTFLIFAFARLFGDGFLPYQLVATLFAWATAIGVLAAARQLGAKAGTALFAGVLYLVWIEIFGGRGGQAGVFMNLFVTWGAVLTLRLPALAEAGRVRTILWNGVAACLLAGIAIQIKYTPAVEGAFFGLCHLWFLRKAGGGWPLTIAAGALWALAGLAPTLAVIGAYAAMGHYDAFMYANFWSIGGRGSYPQATVVGKFFGIVAKTSPLWVCAVFALRRFDDPKRAILIGWIVAAFIAFLAIGTFILSYALSLIAPFLIAAIPLFDRKRRVALMVFLFAAILWVRDSWFYYDDESQVRLAAAILKANSGNECPYVFEGDTILYHLAKSCLPGRYPFPSHLWLSTETGAIGVDQVGEVRRILANRPPVIVITTQMKNVWNRQVLDIIRRELRANYRPIQRYPREDFELVIYLRNDRTPVTLR
jgi:hypothetical protein